MWSACTGYKGASDWFIDSNIQLALAASKMVSPTVFMKMQNSQSMICSLFASHFVQASISEEVCHAPQIRADSGKRVHIVVPDGGEYNRSYKMYVFGALPLPIALQS